MAVNPSEMPEHPNDPHENGPSSLEEAPPADFSTIVPPQEEEDTSTQQIDENAANSWSDMSWSGRPVQPNQATPSTGQNHPDQNQVPNNTVHSVESSDILRGRADSLLDEMMLGAVDISAGAPTPNGAYNPTPVEPRPEFPQSQYEQSAPLHQPIGNPQSTHDGYTADYAADLGGPTTPAQPPNPNPHQGTQPIGAQQPYAQQPYAQQPYEAPLNPPHLSPQLDAPQEYPTVSREISNHAQANYANPAANPNMGDRQHLYGQSELGAPTASGSPMQPAPQYPPAAEGPLYPPSSIGSQQQGGQQPQGDPQQQSDPHAHGGQPPIGYPQNPDQPSYHQPAELRPPEISGPDSYPDQQPPLSSYASPNRPAYNHDAFGPGAIGGETAATSSAPSGISYFEQQRLSYAERYAFEREQERKQWSIATGKSNDYLSSVPRYPRETRDEFGRETENPYNPASTLPPIHGQGQYNAPPTGQYEQPQYPPGQYPQNPTPAGHYPPAPNPANYQSGQQGQPQYGQPQQGQPQQGQPQYGQPQYDQAQGQQQYSQPQYSQGQYTQPGPPAYQGHIPELGPVSPGQQRTSPFADPMSVGSQSRQMDLLPRETKMSVQALQEEMLTLHSKIDTSLPIGHDTADRARHLLDKGRAILEQDPYRSAEVSYYVQQVKAILQRAGQRTQWSNTYRTRLLYYLVGWFFLSLITLVSCMIYSDQLRSFFVRSVADPNTTILGQHSVPFLAAVAAGTFGSAIAALFNMWRYSQRDYGFFDRKYGLLGVVLPIISFLFAMVVYLLFGFIAELFNIQPSSNLLISVIPAVIAFAFGTMQEKIYGTSD